MSAVRQVGVAVSLPRSFLRPGLLLLLAEGTSHGYDLVEQVRALGLAKIDAAGVYRCLRAMDEEGLLRSRWEPSTTGPARRTYVLTHEGSQRLEAMADDALRMEEALRSFLNRCSLVAPAEGP